MGFFVFTTASRPALGPSPVSYLMDTEGKAAGPWRKPLISI